MKQKITTLSLFLFACIFLQGCVNGYQQFYQSEASGTYAPTKNVSIYSLDQESLQTALRDGYIVIGESNFNGPFTDKSFAIAQAKKVGADIVFLDCQRTGSTQGVVPITQYNPGQTTTVQSFGSVYGSGGYARGMATSFVTTPGYTTTQYVPYSVEQYDHHAVFLKRINNVAIETTVPLPDKIKSVDTKTCIKTLIDMATNYFLASDEVYLDTIVYDKAFVAKKWGTDKVIDDAKKRFENGYRTLYGISCDNDECNKIKEAYLKAYKDGIDGVKKMIEVYVKYRSENGQSEDLRLLSEGQNIVWRGQDYLKDISKEFKKLILENCPDYIDNVLPYLLMPEHVKGDAILGAIFFMGQREIILATTSPFSPLKRFDTIIGVVGGEKFPSMVELSQFLAKHKPGDVVRFEIIRDNENLEETVTLREAS